ncbi:MULTISPECIES: hypothetical protein [Streptomyces]|uniref:hypothetical protein n=1 Tax=Streptomyces TaxID=1883 RepID=UPI00168B8769|nr:MULTISPECIES: hypothetical protein [Streptomyces]MBD3555056.1 hypothetical protein [Streptomyces sp. SP18CM02]MDW4902686.1 hypothetical protein [Streptomyces californicus]
MPESTDRKVFHVWWAGATLTLSLILATASLTWNYPLFAQAAIGVAILCSLILLYKNLKSRRNASGAKDANQARFYIIALAACWALIIVPMAYVALKGRGHPDWSDLPLLVAIGASALTLAIIQGSIAARKSH